MVNTCSGNGDGVVNTCNGSGDCVVNTCNGSGDCVVNTCSGSGDCEVNKCNGSGDCVVNKCSGNGKTQISQTISPLFFTRLFLIFDPPTNDTSRPIFTCSLPRVAGFATMSGAMRCPILTTSLLFVALMAVAYSWRSYDQTCTCLPTHWEGKMASKRRTLDLATGEWLVSENVWTVHYEYRRHRLAAMLNKRSDTKIIADSSKVRTALNMSASL